MIQRSRCGRPNAKQWSPRRAKANFVREAAKAERKRLDEKAVASAAAQLSREKEEVVARQVALDAEQKAARDARYAARKRRKDNPYAVR